MEIKALEKQAVNIKSNSSHNKDTNENINVKDSIDSLDFQEDKVDSADYKNNNEKNIIPEVSSIEEKRKSLPIYLKKKEIIDVISDNPFSIIIGETGSGKTTQIPQYILEHFPNSRIVITQPRRVAAIQMSKRVSYEMGVKLGTKVGYTIRFNDYTCKDTQIKFVTDGILVRECLNNNSLEGYDFIILDEAHERSLFTDILLALIKQAVSRSNNRLKLIVTSATLNKTLFSSYLYECPCLTVEGKLFPVEISYQPCKAEKRVEQSVQMAIRIHLHEQSGHILVFLTGFEECEYACRLTYEKLLELKELKKQSSLDKTLSNKKVNNIEIQDLVILSLYGTQDPEEQSRVFDNTNCRKVIFATNIAETSITVDGIAYVIDCGFVKQKIFNARTSMDYYSISPISKAQATQRLGRAGRTGPGKCIRLYSQYFFENQMNAVSLPEILRVNLSTTILTLKTLGISDVMEFDLLDKPNKDYVIQALKHLYFIQAIDENGVLTELGKEISKFPLDCSYARALICSKFFGIEEDMLSLVAIISAENIFVNINKYDENKKKQLQQIKNSYSDKNSDHILLLNMYKDWKILNNKSKEYCRQHFIQFKALRQAENIKSQLTENLNKCRFNAVSKTYFSSELMESLKKEINNNKELDDYEKISCFIRICLAQGFFMNAVRKVVDLSSLSKFNNNLSNTTPWYKNKNVVINNNNTNTNSNSVNEFNSNLNSNYIRLSDNSVLSIDSTSSICFNDTKCDLLVYTELLSGNNKPLMKQVSVIELKWVADLIKLLRNMNAGKLIAGIAFEDKSVIDKDDVSVVNSIFTNNTERYLNLSEDLKSVSNKEGNEFSNYFSSKTTVSKDMIVKEREILEEKSLSAKERFLQRKRKQEENK